jgi:hypothetical protein
MLAAAPKPGTLPDEQLGGYSYWCFTFGQVLVDSRTVIIFWLSLVGASFSVFLERYIRGKGWDSMEIVAQAQVRRRCIVSLEVAVSDHTLYNTSGRRTCLLLLRN